MEYLLASRHCAKPWDDPVTPLKSGGSVKKKSVCQCKRHRFNSGSERSTGEGNGNLLQYSCQSLVRYSPWGHRIG